jgi:hypothetical protein
MSFETNVGLFCHGIRIFVYLSKNLKYSSHKTYDSGAIDTVPLEEGMSRSKISIMILILYRFPAKRIFIVSARFIQGTQYY